ncbi:MAG: EamA family transporter [Chloroflexi bacterium]|nr:EamA family transporter [Chloroflexota bacterium]
MTARWAALLALYFVWGSTFIAIAVAVQTIPTFLMAGGRFVVAGAILLAWVTLRTGALPRVTRREVRDSAIVGGALLGGGMGLVAWGQQTVPAGITALLIALMPAWLAVFSWALLGERLRPIVAVGIGLGFAGVAILVAPTGTGEPTNPAAVAALLLSPVSWALGSLFAARRARLPRNGLVASAVQMLAGAVVLALMGVATGQLGRLDVSAFSTASLAGVAYLVFVGSPVGFSAYGFLLRTAPLPLVSTYAYVNPVVAVILGVILLNEPLGERLVLGSAVIVGGVALIVTARSRPRPAPGPPAPTREPGPWP